MNIKKIIIFVMVLFMLLPTEAFAKTQNNKTIPRGLNDDQVTLGEAITSVDVDILNYISDNAEITIQEIQGQKALVWENIGGSVTFTCNLNNPGGYNICVTYSMLHDSFGIIERSIKVNDELQFQESSNILFSNRYSDQIYPFEKDEYNNDRMPRQNPVIGFFDQILYERDGMQTEPLQFSFIEGSNTITFTALKGIMAISAIKLVPVSSLLDYQTYLSQWSDYTTDSTVIEMEAEKILYRSGKNILNLSISEPGITPLSIGEKSLNAIGGDNYKYPHDFIEWTFNVPEDNFYNIAFNYKQNFNTPLTSFRTVYIDGVVPFSELLTVDFPFGAGWQQKVLGDDQPYDIFLKKGMHTMRMAVTNAPYRDVAVTIRDVSNELNALDLYIKELIGTNVDIYRIWKIQEYIPTIKGELISHHRTLQGITEGLSQITGADIDDFNNLTAAINDLYKLAEDPDNITKDENSLNNIYTVLSSWETNITSQPLLLDKIYFKTRDADFPGYKAGFLRKLQYTFKSFFKSFGLASMQDINSDPNTVQVWVQRNRDYVDLMQQMADEYYTRETGVKVNINYCPPGTNLLVLANASNKKPDIVTGVDYATPFEFGVRHSLVDLSKFEGFNNIIENVVPGSRIPYKIGDAEYAIAEEVRVQVLYYRTDILDRLEIEIPQTWNETTQALSTLLQNNYNFYYPYGDYLTFMFQNDIDIYSKNGMDLAFNNERGYSAFKFWTDLYIKYGMYPQMASFYQHFRLGDVPIGIAGIDQYMMFDMAAPDISGKWEIALSPGFMDADGNIVRWEAGAQNGVIMFQTTEERQERAWDFLKWWLSTDVQYMFADDLENYYGPEFRYFSANLDVVDRQAWNDQAKEVLLRQLKWYKQLPTVPGGSYMTSREIWNAWNRTVLDKLNYREQLDIAIDNITNEMKSKQKELGFINDDGELLKELNIYSIVKPDN
jgi:ABC-type glycerol-3-phosphate transport system substrate-binding protein